MEGWCWRDFAPWREISPTNSTKLSFGEGQKAIEGTRIWHEVILIALEIRRENMRRVLGRSNIEISAIGMGCWAIGGPFTVDGLPDGWGNVDDNESIRAIQYAIDAGVNFFDTSDAYGAGHSEEVLGRAIKGQRDKVVIATKFGFLIDSQARALTGTDRSVAHLHKALKASLHRLHRPLPVPSGRSRLREWRRDLERAGRSQARGRDPRLWLEHRRRCER
jgi:hypothetical protein